jgi:hypothetical protein
MKERKTGGVRGMIVRGIISKHNGRANTKHTGCSVCCPDSSLAWAIESALRKHENSWSIQGRD